MHLDTAGADPVRVYQLLTGIVTPRPIAWVTTVSPAGVVNLAPFSFFNAFSGNPPVVVFSPTLRRDRSKKDTLLNLERVPEFVVSAATAPQAAAVNATSAELPPDDSEVSHAGLATTPSRHVRPPRVAGAPAALECRVRQIIPLGDGPIAGNLVLGDVVAIHVDDAVLDAAGRVDPRKLRTVARLGADFWCHTSDLFEQKRPWYRGAMATPRVVQLLPMSTDVFPWRAIEDVQQRFFLDDLAQFPRNGRYGYRTSGLSAEPGKVVLFQFDRRVIASAEFVGAERFAEPEDGHAGALYFDPGSVRVFDPVGAEVLAEVWPDQFPGFGQARTRLDGDRYPLFVARLTNVRTPKR